ncbi:unnamed protein product [Auanema sp. JU1783]|nr:unnamed protein product [Auanema sp. JU1783]
MFFLLFVLVCCTLGVQGDVREEFIDEITGATQTGEELDTEGFMEAIVLGLIDSQFSSYDANGDGGIDAEELNSLKNLIPADSPLLTKLQIINYDANRDLKLDMNELKNMVKNHLEEFTEAIQMYFQQMTNGMAHEEF